MSNIDRAGESGREERHLTEGEVRIVALIADGKQNKDIAACLGVPEHQIKNQLRIIFEKLRCSNRAEVVKIALAHGLLKSQL